MTFLDWATILTSEAALGVSIFTGVVTWKQYRLSAPPTAIEHSKPITSEDYVASVIDMLRIQERSWGTHFWGVAGGGVLLMFAFMMTLIPKTSESSWAALLMIASIPIAAAIMSFTLRIRLRSVKSEIGRAMIASLQDPRFDAYTGSRIVEGAARRLQTPGMVAEIAMRMLEELGRRDAAKRV